MPEISTYSANEAYACACELLANHGLIPTVMAQLQSARGSAQPAAKTMWGSRNCYLFNMKCRTPSNKLL